MNKTIKYLVGISLLILIIIIILKPGYRRFNEFASGVNVKPYKIVTKKLNDYLIYAIYQREVYKWDDYEDDYVLVSTEKYSGFLLNFYKM